MNRSLFVAGALLIGANAMACEISTFERLAAESPYGVTIASVDVVVDGTGHCRVEGMIANAENGQSRIRFRLSLPDAASWNGKYLVVGNAGTAGSFQSEARARMGLQLGYVTGQTDTGHTRQGAGGLDPSAGQSYVDYQFKLQSGDYLDTFGLVGINLELSTMSSQYYERAFTSRLRSEVLRITAPGASGVDILDREKVRIPTAQCSPDSSEEAVEAAEGAFVANKSGPVRGIRAHLGFASGSAIEKVHFFYEQREDVAYHWGAHETSEALQLVDYDPAAIGMTYFNNNNLAGVIVDGVPDSVTPGLLQWELITGFHGSLVTIRDVVSSTQNWQRCHPGGVCRLVIPLISSYYLDDDSFPEQLCPGPGDVAIGTSGQALAFTPNTDPRSTSFRLALESSRYYGPPGWTVADAEQLRAFSENSLVTTVAD